MSWASVIKEFIRPENEGHADNLLRECLSFASNLLIAVMTNTYTAISENATNEFLLEKASTLAEIESMMSDSELANKEMDHGPLP